MVTFKKPGWDLQEHCDSASPLLVRLWTRREAGAGTTSPASPRTAPGWSRCARWCWPAPGCPWATWGQCLLSLRHRSRELWAGFCFSRWAIQPYLSNLCINRRSTHIYMVIYLYIFVYLWRIRFVLDLFVCSPSFISTQCTAVCHSMLSRNPFHCHILCWFKVLSKSKYCVNR